MPVPLLPIQITAVQPSGLRPGISAGPRRFQTGYRPKPLRRVARPVLTAHQPDNPP
jgi:hypothetical protein